MSSVRKSPILLEPLFLLIRVIMLLELFSELIKHWNITLFCHCHRITSIIFKDKCSHSVILWDGNPFKRQRVSNDSVGILAYSKTPRSRSNHDHLRESGLYPKARHNLEFLVIVDLSWKPSAHGCPLFHIGLSQLMLDLDPDPVRIKFEILHQYSPNRRYKNWQKSTRTLAKWIHRNGRLGQKEFYQCNIKNEQEYIC